MAYQYVHDTQGNPLYVLVPIEDFKLLTADEDESQWESIPVQHDEFDGVTVPHEVVNIMFDREVSQIAAWRIYRGMTQSEAAAKAGISQAALSQIEKQGSRPQAQTRELFARIYGCSPDQLAG